jgi:hypothetical protein
MTRLAKYSRKAEVALALAEATRVPSAQETYREVAELWHKLAEKAKDSDYY